MSQNLAQFSTVELLRELNKRGFFDDPRNCTGCGDRKIQGPGYFYCTCNEFNERESHYFADWASSDSDDGDNSD